MKTPDILSMKNDKSFEKLKESKETYVVWLTGLSGAGKTTLASALLDSLESHDIACELLDGDVVRKTFNQDLDFSRKGRSENVKRLAHMAYHSFKRGNIVIVSAISPFRDDRQRARHLIPKDRFIEVYCSCPIEICEERDVKGLYRKARAGEIDAFTGISSPYEAPLQPEITIDSSTTSIQAGILNIANFVNSNLKSRSTNLHSTTLYEH